MRSDNPGFVPDSPFSKQLPEEWLNFFKTFPKLCLLYTSPSPRDMRRTRMTTSA